ncbi:HSF-type DNA-binding-domain-containing protein [Pelagophyceae sp. CCMP2097]|nr:HSF-type DNA-binding-domain-containing protein [Pelagophyceae sp. CCMP2097]
MLAIPKAPALALPVAPAAAPDDAAAALALRRPLEAPPEIPVFIRTLYRLLNQVDPEIIRWADDGTHIVITNSTRFAAEACPKFFRHRNFQSFTRLLNMYQFSKVSARDAKIGCYAHEFFKRGKEELLYKIHRKPREEKKKKRGLVEAGKADPAAEKDAKEAKAGPSSVSFPWTAHRFECPQGPLAERVGVGGRHRRSQGRSRG